MSIEFLEENGEEAADIIQDTTEARFFLRALAGLFTIINSEEAEVSPPSCHFVCCHFVWK